MTAGTVDEGDELLRALLSSVCHDLGSPLSSLTANVTLAAEVLTDAAPDGPRADDLSELGEMLDDMRVAIGSLTALVADLREMVGSRPAEGAVGLEPSVTSALRLARLPIARARVVVERADLGDAAVTLERSALVRAIALSVIALVRGAGPDSRLAVGRAPDGTAGLALELTPAVSDAAALRARVASVAEGLRRVGGTAELEAGARDRTRVVLSGSRGEPSSVPAPGSPREAGAA